MFLHGLGFGGRDRADSIKRFLELNMTGFKMRTESGLHHY